MTAAAFAERFALCDAAAKELWLVPGADHGTDELQRHPDYGARLAPFVAATCPP